MITNQINDRRIKFQILNANGHDELMLDLDRAVDTIVSKCVNEGRFSYVNGQLFQFDAASLREDKASLQQDKTRLRNLLSAVEDASVMLTDALQGGKNK